MAVTRHKSLSSIRGKGNLWIEGWKLNPIHPAWQEMWPSAAGAGGIEGLGETEGGEWGEDYGGKDKDETNVQMGKEMESKYIPEAEKAREEWVMCITDDIGNNYQYSNFNPSSVTSEEVGL